MTKLIRYTAAFTLLAASIAAFGWCWSLQLVLRGGADGVCFNTGSMGGSSKRIHTPEYYLDCGATPTYGCEKCSSKPSTRTEYRLEWDSQGCPGRPARIIDMGSTAINLGTMSKC